MKRILSHTPISVVLLAFALMGTACNKDDNGTTPEYGYAKLGNGSDVKFNFAYEGSTSPYILSNQGPNGDQLVTVTVQLPAKPTAAADLNLGGSTYVSYIAQVNGVAQPPKYFGGDGQKVSAQIVDGKVRLILKDLTEVDITHKPVSGSALTLSGTLSGQ